MVKAATSDYIATSQALLYAVRTEDDAVEKYLDTIGNADMHLLYQQLSTDNNRIAFWLNIYNAYVQWMLKKNPERYQKRSDFFRSKEIIVAGKKLSLDDVEHGILRRSKIKWSLGYFNKVFVSIFEKKFRVTKPDYRIHFALNCGAKSCPPIAYYSAEKIDKELEMATKNYLNKVHYDEQKNKASLPAIMGWFRADFGGKKGLRNLLKKYSVIPLDAHPVIEFKKYDWTLFLNNYKTG